MLRITNSTGLTIHTSAHDSSPSVALADRPVEMPAAAWEHTLSCGPGLRSLVGHGPGKIEVVDLAAPVAVVPDEVVETLADPVEAEVVEPPKAAPPAPQGKGKQRR